MMFQKIKLGDREVIEPVEIPERTGELLSEILAQNKMIIESNIMAMKIILNPAIFISNDSDN